MNSLYREHLKKKLSNSEFRREYGAALAQNEIAVTINGARLAAGLTQIELAEKMGVSQAYIAKLESGHANPSISKVGEILALLEKQIQTHYIAILPSGNRVINESVDLTVWGEQDSAGVNLKSDSGSGEKVLSK